MKTANNIKNGKGNGNKNDIGNENKNENENENKNKNKNDHIIDKYEDSREGEKKVETNSVFVIDESPSVIFTGNNKERKLAIVFIFFRFEDRFINLKKHFVSNEAFQL